MPARGISELPKQYPSPEEDDTSCDSYIARAATASLFGLRLTLLVSLIRGSSLVNEFRLKRLPESAVMYS
jgi:hypothetical protein